MLRHLLFALVLATGAGADPIPAAGRIESAASPGTCSAVLIEPDLVLTAAHCLGDDVAGMSFRPGKGETGPVFGFAASSAHPFYDPDQTRPNWKVRFDIRAGRLVEPVPGWVAAPLPIGQPATVGERLFLISWRRSDGPLPRQRACPVLSGPTGIVTLGCAVEGGESGAPVLRKTEDGLELVAIVSSRSTVLNQPVALATNASLRVQPILDLLD